MTTIIPPSDVNIRPASADDAERLAELGRDTFAATFGHLYPASDLAFFQNQSHTPQLYAGWAKNADFGLWIAERSGQAIGYALAGPCHLPHPEVSEACGELWRIYLRAEAQGTGLGQRLMQTALEWLTRPGRRLWIGVFSGNLKAQALYAKYGFKKVGDYEFCVGETRDPEFILMREPD